MYVLLCVVCVCVREPMVGHLIIRYAVIILIS